jgi:glycosyltransferase involved in cell wall biosynthesis
MPSVLMFLYEYPPANSVATFRSLSIVRGLAKLGWDVTIITTNRNASKVTYVEDVSRTSNVEVVRARESLPLPRYPFLPLGHGYSTPFLFGDRTLSWVFSAITKAKEVIKTKEISCLFASYPPASAMFSASYIARISRKPLIMDVRDPWISDNPFYKMDSIRRRILRGIGRAVLRNSSVVVTVYSRSESGTDSALPTSGTLRIGNGFDREQFDSTIPTKFDRTTILHAGGIYGLRENAALVFLRSLRSLYDDMSLSRDEHQAIFVGDVSPKCRSEANSLSLAGNVKFIPWVGHKDALAMIKGADSLLLIPGYEDAITAKIYEYLAARKPILNIGARMSEVARMITKYGVGVSCNLSVEEVRNGLLQIQGDIRQRARSFAQLDELTRDYQFQKYVKVFDSVVRSDSARSREQSMSSSVEFSVED